MFMRLNQVLNDSARTPNKNFNVLNDIFTFKKVDYSDYLLDTLT